MRSATKLRQLTVSEQQVESAIYEAKFAKLNIRERRERADETKSTLELQILSKDESAYVRFGVVLNANANGATVQRLADDPDPAIRYAALQHRAAPETLPQKRQHAEEDPNVSGYVQFLIAYRGGGD